MNGTDRKSILRTALLEAAERAVANGGLAGLKTRSLASEVGCAVGAIYNVFADLDELVLAVNARTLAALEAELAAVSRSGGDEDGGDEDGGAEDGGAVERASELLVRLAAAYLDFAVAHKELWRALFEFRLAAGKDVPQWFLADRSRLFDFVELPLRDLLPLMAPEACSMLARSMFSAVHGVVALGLEEKLGVVSLEDLRRQTRLVVRALATGLASSANSSYESGPTSK